MGKRKKEGVPMPRDRVAPKKKRCYIYTRVSTAMQVEGYSLDAQRERLLREAKHRDMVIASEFSDEGKSGKNVTGRPAFQEMMGRIQDGNPDGVDYVLVFKLSRFGRNTADVLNNLQIMEDYGVSLLAAEDGIDSAGAAGKLMIAVLAAVAEIERENIQAQTMAGRMQKAREGKWNGGQAPIGYRIDKERGTLVIEPEEAEMVRLIFDRYLNSGEGCQRIARWMNDHGYRRKPREGENGKYELFATHIVRQILDNPVYAGKIAYGRRKREKVPGTRNESHMVRQSEYMVVPGKHEAIISESDWTRVCSRRGETGGARPKTHSLEHEHVLSGLLRCPECGAPMYGSVNRKRKKDGTFYKDSWYYVCKNRKSVTGQVCGYRRQPPQGPIDDEVVAMVSDAIRSPSLIDKMRAEMDTRTDEERIKAELAALQKARTQYVGAKDKLCDRLDSLDVLDPAYDAKYADMERRLDALYLKIAEADEDILMAENDLARANGARVSLQAAYELLERRAADLPSLPDWMKKECIASFVDYIEIYPERQPDGRWVKNVRFRFPVMLDGEHEAWEWSRDDGHDETIVLLQRENS